MSLNENHTLEELFEAYHKQIYQFTYRYTQDEMMCYPIVIPLESKSFSQVGELMRSLLSSDEWVDLAV